MVTLDDVKAELKPHSYNMLTGGDDTFAERALEKSRIWLTARLTEAGLAPNEEDEVQRQIIIKYALYELHSSAEQEAVAKDKKDDALELIGAYLSRTAGSKAGDANVSAPPEASVVKPRRGPRI